MSGHRESGRVRFGMAAPDRSPWRLHNDATTNPSEIKITFVTHLAQANVSKQPKQPRSTTSILSLPTWLLLAGNMVTLADDSSIAMATTLNYNYGANVIKSDQSPECLKKR